MREWTVAAMTCLPRNTRVRARASKLMDGSAAAQQRSSAAAARPLRLARRQCLYKILYRRDPFARSQPQRPSSPSLWCAPHRAVKLEPEAMENSPRSGEAEAERERQLQEDLALLHRERQQIMAAFNAVSSPLFHKLQKLALKRLQMAADHRDLELASLQANFHLQLQQAYNEFECSKRRLRARMLTVNVDKRKRLDGMKSVQKKRKRSRSYYEQRAARKASASPFLNGLEKQGVLRVGVTPDELMADMNELLNAIEVPAQKSSMHVDRVAADGVVVLDKIHSSKGTLHYHDLRLEKGDAVELYSVGKNGGVLKYGGVLMSVNAKEVHIRADNGTDHRIYVSHLRSGKLSLKLLDGGNSNGAMMSS